MKSPEECAGRLAACFRQLPGKGIGIAFSGGADSAVLLHEALLDAREVLALTVRTFLQKTGETARAEACARRLNAEWCLLSPELPAEVLENPPDRCYFCKKNMFRAMRSAMPSSWALCDGTHADDARVYRPGRKALAEEKVFSPFLECGMTGEEVRALGRYRGLPEADLPSESCLASRLPYGKPLEEPLLRRLEAAEEYLHTLGFGPLRARYHDPVLRLELSEPDLPLLPGVRREIVEHLKGAGFGFITLDLSFFRSGSMDEGLKNPGSGVIV